MMTNPFKQNNKVTYNLDIDKVLDIYQYISCYKLGNVSQIIQASESLQCEVQDRGVAAAAAGPKLRLEIQMSNLFLLTKPVGFEVTKAELLHIYTYINSYKLSEASSGKVISFPLCHLPTSSQNITTVSSVYSNSYKCSTSQPWATTVHNYCEPVVCHTMIMSHTIFCGKNEMANELNEYLDPTIVCDSSFAMTKSPFEKMKIYSLVMDNTHLNEDVTILMCRRMCADDSFTQEGICNSFESIMSLPTTKCAKVVPIKYSLSEPRLESNLDGDMWDLAHGESVLTIHSSGSVDDDNTSSNMSDCNCTVSVHASFSTECNSPDCLSKCFSSTELSQPARGTNTRNKIQDNTSQRQVIFVKKTGY